ncbi:MAG: hypothetical protein WB713_13355, partial [Methyloceanibacter sp.]
AATGPTKEFTEDDVNAAVKKVVDERTKDGAFVFRDPKLNADLHLIFDQIKNVRGMHGYGWFPNVIFHDKDEPKKQYAIDFWFKPEGQDLKLMDIRVQKGPKQEGDSWVMITRSPQAWWWLPAGEHPGDMEVTRAWQVMSAIHGYIATHKDEPKKQYAIDFWFKPEGQDLKLMDIRVQKGPKQEGDSWVMITRSPQAWWWLPAGEHPGDMEVTRAWQVMSAIHGYIATHKDKDGNLEIKDDKTGETLPLEFVEIHQPVRHLKKEGEYFACTDFRKPGSQDEYYDIDFWVNQKTGKLQVDNVKVHKVPVQEDGVWTQVPRYTFDGMDIEETN